MSIEAPQFDPTAGSLEPEVLATRALSHAGNRYIVYSVRDTSGDEHDLAVRAGGFFTEQDLRTMRAAATTIDSSGAEASLD